MRKVYTYYNGTACPVNAFIKETDKKIKKKLMFCIDFIKDEKNCFCEPHVKHFVIEKYSRLFELRAKAATTMVRIIFYEHNGAIYLLYAFYKRDRKDTERALETGLRILENITDKNGDVIENYREEMNL